MVDEGKVLKEDKEGNDEADDAAEKRSIGEQPKNYHLARLYARRQKAFEDLIARIHTFIIKLKGAERQMRKDVEAVILKSRK